jgi:hypothetical protein
MKNARPARRARSALLAPAMVGILAALAAAAPALAQGTDCASAEARVAARAGLVCSPASALSPAQELACAEHARWTSIAADCRRAAERDDRRWLTKFPTEASHRSAELGELETVVLKLRAPNERLAALLAERTVLAQKVEFYPNALPLELRREVEANDASLLAVRDVFKGLEAEIGGIVDKYADERIHLKKLWAGAAPGSLGVFVPHPARASTIARASPPGRT